MRNAIGIGIGPPFQIGGMVKPNGDPSNLVAVTVSDTQIDLTTTIGSTNQDGLSWERSTDGVTFAVIGTSVLGAYSDTTAVANTEYWYHVRAFKGTQYSGYSNVDSTTTYIYEVLKDSTADNLSDSTTQLIYSFA